MCLNFKKLCLTFDMSLTETKINKYYAKKRKSIIELPDRDGLVAKVGLSGKVSWVYRYRFSGQHKRLTFASYPATSISKARESVISYIAQLELGNDPKYALNNAEIVTIEHCRDEWLSLHVVDLKPKTQAFYKSISNKYFTNDRFPHDIQSGQFEHWLSFFDRIAKDSSKVNSGSALKTVKSMLKWCRSRNIIQSSRAFDINLSAVGKAPKQGQRNLDLDEVALLWVTVGRSRAQAAVKACVKLLIIFGARNSEVRAASRSEFDLEKMIWTLPEERSKTGKIVRRAIPDTAKSIILELDQLYGDKGFLIKGQHRNTCTTVHSIDRFTKRIWGTMAAIKTIEKFTPHDFRRTLSTRLSEREVLPHVTEKMLGHELGGVMAIYNKHDWIDEQRKAYELWCSMIEQAVSELLSSPI